MTQLTIDSTEIDVFIRLALLGVGTAVFQSPTTRAIMAKIPDGQAGVASGILVTMRNLGMVFAICYASILLNTTIMPNSLQMNILSPLEAYNLTVGMHLVVLLWDLLSILMALLSVVGMLTGKMIKREVLDRIKSD